MLMGKPLDDDFFGVEFQVGKGYDFFTTSVYEFLWQAGGDIWDETKQPNGHAARRGELRRRRSSRSSTCFRSSNTCRRKGPTGNLDIFKTDELFRAGKVASNLEWIGFAESSIHADTSKVADKIAFAQLPGTKTDKGIERWSVIGGQPFVLMTWNTDVQNKEALDFCKWWLSKDAQIEFAKAGGQSALKSVYTDPSYVTLPALEPHLGGEPRLAEGLLAHPGVLRTADASSRKSTPRRCRASRTPRRRWITSPTSRKRR